MHSRRYLLVVASLVLAAAAAAGQDVTVQDGVASWYGGGFHGRTTSNGEVYDMDAFTAAHRTLPFGSRVRVTNQENGRQVVVRINDRGPFVAGRIIDLSRAAATFLDMLGAGTVSVRLEVLPRAAPEERVFAVQVGAFVKPENAQRVQFDLRTAGIEAVIERTTAVVTRVVVDPVSEAELGATLRLVASMGFTDCLVKERATR
jgi:rare lipoprotein A